VVNRTAELAPCRIICEKVRETFPKEEKGKTYDGKQSPINSRKALFPDNGYSPVNKAAVKWLRSLCIAYQFGSERVNTSSFRY